MFNFYIRDEFKTIACNVCIPDIGDESFSPLTMKDIPSGIFKCYYCDEYFIVYDGRLFMEYVQ